MAQLTIVRDGGWAWSKWNAAVLMIDATLDRYGLDREGEWRETDAGRVFVGSSRACEAIATALEGLGLKLERTGVTAGNA